MKEIKAFRSTDGRIFESEGECRTHEQIIKKEKDLEILRKNLNAYLEEDCILMTPKETFEFLSFVYTQLKLVGTTLESIAGGDE